MNEPDGIDTGKPVLVTGASGYVAGWIVKRLLESGYTVHAAVRDPNNPAKVAHLERLAAELPGTLRFYKADLLEDGSYAEAMEGCAVVFHTASPFTLDESDPQKKLIEPALEGTRNVLRQANATDSVRRVVLTSSCAAIYGDNADIRATRSGRFTEDDWNTTSSLDHKPYSFSKTLAEREAWKIASVQDRWDLVTINPSLVLGPGIKADTTSGSSELIGQLAGGRLRLGVPDYAFGAVDVRDVAEAHYRAGTDLSVESGRYIVSGHDTSLPELAAILRRHFGDRYPFPRGTLPKWMAWVFGPLVDRSLSRRLIARNVGIPARWDNSKSRRVLNMRYTPLETSVTGMFQQMIEAGLVRA